MTVLLSVLSFSLLFHSSISTMTSGHFQAKDGPQVMQLLRHANELSTVPLYESLPKIYILPIDSKFYDNARSFLGPECEHCQCSLFLEWLNTSYHNTVQSGDDAQYYYIPACRKVSWEENEWWYALSKELGAIAENASYPFSLDRSFLPATVPIWTTHEFNPNSRNIFDIRLLRYDIDKTSNGRDIFVPYAYLDKTKFANPQSTYDLMPKKLFIFAPCAEAGGMMEGRGWRTKIFQMWKNTAQSYIIQEKVAFDKYLAAMQNSDFCLVMPGDTTSTGKLSQYLFAGCIPVIFVSFYSQLPFFDLIEWGMFSVVVMKDLINYKDGMDELMKMLQEIRADTKKLSSMKHSLVQARSLLDYTRHEWPSVYVHDIVTKLKRYLLITHAHEIL